MTTGADGGAADDGAPVRRATTATPVGRTPPLLPAPVDPFYVNDDRFPWRTVGRLDTGNGWATGVLVGPRHVLTAAHVLPWRSREPADGVTGPVRFTPAAFDAREPFGAASAIGFACLMVTDPPTIDGLEERLDYAVCVLDTAIGRKTGWMGAKAYRDAWDGVPCWSHLGYRGTHALATRPSYQSGIALRGHDVHEDTHQVMYHRADTTPGQSGGPIFGWWEGESFPSVVAVQSWRGADISGASGGDRLVELVARTRDENP
jgi:hypothetical protein